MPPRPVTTKTKNRDSCSLWTLCKISAAQGSGQTLPTLGPVGLLTPVHCTTLLGGVIVVCKLASGGGLVGEPYAALGVVGADNGPAAAVWQRGHNIRVGHRRPVAEADARRRGRGVRRCFLFEGPFVPTPETEILTEARARTHPRTHT